MSWHRTPFIRILFPFLIGLCLAYYFPSKLAAYSSLIGLLLSLPTLFYWGKLKKISPAAVSSWAVLMSIGFLALGYGRTFGEDARHWEGYLEQHIEQGDSSTYLARIQSKPQLKNSSVSLQLELLEKGDSLFGWKPLHGKLLVSLELDSLSAQLAYGQGILFRAEIRAIEPAINPNAFNAKQFYRHKNIHHRTYLKSAYWQRAPKLDAGSWLKKSMLNWRSYLLSLFQEELGNHSNEYAVAAALILGARNAISSDLRNAYADTGATHVLAVSGLHVGLVVMLLSLLLNFGKKRNKTPWLEAILLLFGIWSFAFLTGASPSVVRASTMFSFLTIGDALGRKSSIYNTLAASAFFILCIQPLAFWDLGFQLSYLAVIGIVYLQPKIYKCFYIPNKIGDYIWNLTSVSLAAQLATLPISLLYFHQFPVYFWLSGLVVIPLATIILVLGIATLVFSFIPLLSSVLAQLLYYFIFAMNAAIFSIQQLPFAKLEGFWLESWEAGLWYFVIISFIIGIVYKFPRWNLAALVALLFLGGAASWKSWQCLKQQKVFVYRVYRGSTIDFIQGQEVVTLADSLHLAPKQLEWTNRKNLWAHGVKESKLYELHRDSVDLPFLWMNRSGYGQFGEQRFAILPRALASRPLAANQALEVDWVLLQGNPYLKDLSELERLINYRYLVFDGSNSPWRLAAWRQACEMEGIPYIDCSKKGQELPQK